jgi:hypothetical protein
MEKHESVLLRLPASLKKQLEEAAVENRRSANMEARVAIEEHVRPVQGAR